MALFSYDINEDGVKELIVGWASGRVGGWVHSCGTTVPDYRVAYCISTSAGGRQLTYTHTELITGDLTPDQTAALEQC